MLETDLETEACREVLMLGGKVRKVRWIGRRDAPDRLFLLPILGPAWVEFKKPIDGILRASQLREIETMRRYGCRVEIIDTREKLAAFLAEVRQAIAMAIV